MTEEYTGPKRCDLCKYEKDAPCPGKGCNSVNGLKCFEPKGVHIEGSKGWEIISFLWDQSDGHLLINLKSKAGVVLMAHVSPDDLAGLVLPAEMKEEIDNT